MADAANGVTPVKRQGDETVAHFRRIIAGLVGALFLHPAKMEGDVAQSSPEGRRAQQFVLRRKKVTLVVVGAKVEGREEIVIVETQLLGLGPRHRLEFRGPEASVTIAGLFERDVVTVNPAAGVEGLAPGVSDDVDLAVAADLGVDPGLPVHQFMAELADERTGHENGPGKEADAQRAESAGDLVAKRKLVGDGARRFLKIKGRTHFEKRDSPFLHSSSAQVYQREPIRRTAGAEDPAIIPGQSWPIAAQPISGSF